MRVLYGVVGEGMGHAIRSRVVIDALSREHEVRVVASGRARDYLAGHFDDVEAIWGLTIAYRDNEVRSLQTLARNLHRGIRGLPANGRRLLAMAEDFAPDVVVTDFESFAYVFAKMHRVPAISVDNIQMIARCRHDPDVTAGVEADFRMARQIVRAKLPSAAHYLITTFFRPPVAAPRTTLVPSILRPEILAAERERGGHLLVYQTAEGNTALPEALREAGVPSRVYGFRRDLEGPERDGDITYLPFDEAGFVEDLATARAVVAGGGFTLLSEAVYLGKPILSVPVRKQFEQVMNARYVGKLGYGAHVEAVTPEAIRSFVESSDRYAERVGAYHQDGNEIALAALRDQLALSGRRAHPAP
jgi:uncharacterized protein (TIGR00661 family)